MTIIIPFVPSLLILYLTNWPDKTNKEFFYAFIPALSWVFSFILLILSAFILNDFNIYFFDPMLKVSLFVPIAAFLGTTSYISISVLKNIERNPIKWKLIYVAYGRRLLMAPYIAIIALFTITELAQINNPWTVLFFAYFVGLYTKEIEGTLEEIGKKFLTEKQKKELEDRNIEALEIVKRLGISTDVMGKLIKLEIRQIGDLLAIREEKIEEIAKKAEITDEYLKELKNKAINQCSQIDLMKIKLGLDRDRLLRLVEVGIYSIEDLCQIDDKCLSEIAESSGIHKDCLENLVRIAKNDDGKITETYKYVKWGPKWCKIYK